MEWCCLSVCRSVCHDPDPCKNGWTDRDAVWKPKEACIRWGTRWHHLANIIELSVCGGDAAFCQITFTTCAQCLCCCFCCLLCSMLRFVDCWLVDISGCSICTCHWLNCKLLVRKKSHVIHCQRLADQNSPVATQSVICSLVAVFGSDN